MEPKESILSGLNTARHDFVDVASIIPRNVFFWSFSNVFPAVADLPKTIQ